MHRPLIDWYGPLDDSEGFAEEGRGLVAALRGRGCDVRTTSIPHPRTFSRIPLMRNIDVTEGTPPRVAARVYHRYWTARPLPGPGPHIWRSMFETDSVPREWVAVAKEYDQIWVPTDFNIQTYANAGIPRGKLVRVPCPLPVWSSLLVRNLDRPRVAGARAFVFLSVMRWHLRKGWDILVRAFAQEFGGETDVRLMIKGRPFDPSNPETPHRELARFFEDIGEPLPANISVVTREMSHAEMADLYGRADAFVLASRGEGWGRPFIESMLSGLPTIGPRWGGNLQFMNDDNSVLVGGVLTPVQPRARDEWPYFAGHRWWEASVDELRQAMRHVVEAARTARSDVAATEKRRETARQLLKTYASEALGDAMVTSLE